MQWTGSPPIKYPDPADWDTITYGYDPAGRRIEKTVDDKYTTKYCYDGGNVIAEYDSNNNLLRKYIYGPRVDEPVCMIDAVADDAEYYYHYDALGSVVALSDSNGDTVQTYEYSVYGQVAAEDPNFLTNPYMFTGRRFDLETGLYYYRARYYNPHIGRFMQTDPVGYGAGMNWYAYCGNNPLAYTDPSGLGADYNEPNGPNEPPDSNWVGASIKATVLIWADVLGIYGDFGRLDTFDANYLKTLINPYPEAGSEEVIGNEEAWGYVHYGVGFAMGLSGIDRESAETLMKVWEWTEPGIWSFWGERIPFQGRDNFEGGELGVEFDIMRGLQGYDDAVYWKQYLEEFFLRDL